MKQIGRKTLKREVFLLSLLFSLTLCLVFILIISNVLYNARLSEMKEKLHGSSAQIATYMNTMFDGSQQLLIYLDATEDLTSQDPLQQQALQAHINRELIGAPHIEFIFVGYPDGSLLIDNYEMPPGYAANERPWYRKALEKYPDMLVAYPYQEYVNNQWCFCTAQAIAGDDGEIAAVVIVGYFAQALYENVQAMAVFEAQDSFAIDQDGVCVYHINPDRIGTRIVNVPDSGPNILEDEEGFIDYTADGQKRIGYFHQINDSDYLMVTSANRGAVFLPAGQVVATTALGLLILSIMLSSLFMTLFDRRYVSPVKSLKERLAALLMGKTLPDSPGVYPNQEFLEIAGSIEALTIRMLSQKTELLNKVMEAASDGILVLDRTGTILHYNPSFIRLWGLEDTQTYQTLEDLGLSERLIEGSAHCGLSALDEETELCFLKTGIVMERYTRVLSGLGDVDGVFCVFRDVTQKVKKEEQLKRIANTDYLTGLHNRRYFMFLAAGEMNLALEDGKPMALLMIDVDHFKNINDTYGHDIGDQTLREFARRLRTCSRKSDVLGRYGGDEFTVVLPNTDAQTACQIAERVHLHFQSNPMHYQGGTIAWTVSVGVANLKDKIGSIDALIKHADIACYEAKQCGRNRVRIYGGGRADAGAQNNTEE